eukprot:g8222.t1
MIGRGGARARGKGENSGNANMVFAGLFPGSDSDEEQDYGGRTAAAPAAKKRGAAQQDWSLFPDKEETLAQPATPPAKGGRRSKHHRAASTVTGVTAGSVPVNEKVADAGTREQNPGKQAKKKNKAKKQKPRAAGKEEKGETISYPSRTGVEDDDEIDLEAARGTRPPSKPRSAEERAIDEFELSWKTGCWGLWTSLADAEDVQFVEFDTHIGWQMYGKGDKLGFLSEINENAAVVGGLAGGMHTLMIFVAFTFLFFSVSALWLSYVRLCCPQRRPSEEVKEEDGPVKPARHENPLGLGRDCHRWMFFLAVIDIFAGLWCFSIGCAGFYWVVTRELTEGLEKLVSGWGEDVSCARPQTSPRYGFFVNAVSVVLLLGGGIISLYKTYTCDRDLSEAVEMWEHDRAETAEMESRLAMIKKKEDYAAAVASAAASAAQAPVTIFKSKKTSPVAAASTNEAANVAALPTPPPDGVDGVLPLSPSSEISRQSTRSFTAVPGPGQRHNRKVTMAALSSVDLESDDGTVNGAASPASALPQPSIPEEPYRQTSEPGLGSASSWDVEAGVGAAGGAGAGTGAAAAATQDNAGKGGVDDDMPPPQGWEVRTTPSGDK